MLKVIFLFFYIFAGCCLLADELTKDPPLIWTADCISCRPPPFDPCLCAPEDGSVEVDLRNPKYEDGVLTTDEGGVLVTQDLRIQARRIVYTHNLEDDPAVFTVFCEGDLLVDYKEWALLGDQFYYDFQTNSGYLINGKTADPPWYVGGREILILQNGNLTVLDGYVTTSEGEWKDVSLCSPQITLTPDRVATAIDVHLRVRNIPILWIPYLSWDFNTIGESPFAFKFGWGGFLGSHVSVLYNFLSWKELYATARFDWFFGHGPGIGIETVYDPPNRPTQFYTRNYYAHDIAIDDPIERDRYRFQGTFYDRIYDVTIDAMYDFVSDAKMAADYETDDFALNTAGRTQIELRRKEPFWIANFFTRVRVNDFQSVNQELPSFQLHWHPHEIPHTGAIVENHFSAAYLHYVFSDDVRAAIHPNFHSGRIAVRPKIYRPFMIGPILTTPEIGAIGIAYTNSPGGKSAGQAIGEIKLHSETSFFRQGDAWKHILEPYIDYRFLTTPRVPLDHHFIFTINDGYTYLNLLRFGIRNSLFSKYFCDLARPIWIDLWANAFFNTSTVEVPIPKGYLSVEWEPYRHLLFRYDGGWNFQKGLLDFSNTRLEWSVNENLAFAVEWRHSSKYDWRKADFYNFILESARSIEELLHSPLSDARDTFLFRTFVRPSPKWTVLFNLRYAKNHFAPEILRPQKSLLEYEIELTTRVFEHWRWVFSFEDRQTDHRFAFYLKLDPGPPPAQKHCF